MAMKAISSVLALCATSAVAVSQVKVQGSEFVDGNNKRFDIVGVAYQPGGSAGFGPGRDPLSDSKACGRDAAVMQKLGVNTIRVYNLDPAAAHDECVAIFNAAGIYMILDVNSPLPGQALSAGAPSSSYASGYMTRVFTVIEAFRGYDNLIGFFAGNEVINDITSGGVDPPYIRAVVRDMKTYMAKRGGRQVPVGYSAADVRPILQDTFNYLTCGQSGDDSQLSRIDFFGLNSYSWCGDSTMQTSGYDVLLNDFNSTAVPVFFSEYGCNAVMPRTFTEVAALYGPDMSSVFTGGMVYEYAQEANNYGLVNISADGSATLTQDFNNLQAAFNKLDAGSLTRSQASMASPPAPPACASSIIKNAAFNSDFNLPAVPSGVQDLIDNGIANAPAGTMRAPASTSVAYAVYDNSNAQIADIALKVLENGASDSPSGANSTGSQPSQAGHQGAAAATAAPAPAVASGSPTVPGKAAANATANPTTSASAKPSSAAGHTEAASVSALLGLVAAAYYLL